MNETTCDRCGAEAIASSMSYFNTDTICHACRERERAHPKFDEARRAEHDAVRAGNTNFPGIGLPPELARQQSQQSPGHTPGPWTVKGLEVIGAHGLRVCEVDDHVDAERDNTTDADDNARLIAAAPDLLAALEALLRAPSVGSSGPGCSVTIAVQTFNLNAARAALAKAKGTP